MADSSGVYNSMSESYSMLLTICKCSQLIPSGLNSQKCGKRQLTQCVYVLVSNMLSMSLIVVFLFLLLYYDFMFILLRYNCTSPSMGSNVQHKVHLYMYMSIPIHTDYEVHGFCSLSIC